MRQLLCLGDSITDCGHLLDTPPLGSGYVSMLARKLNTPAPSWRVTNAGADGFTIRRVLDILPRFSDFRPDAVTLLVGINDVGVLMNTFSSLPERKARTEEALENYRTLVDMLRRRTGRLLLMEPFIFPRPLEFAHWQPYVLELSRGIAHLAREYRCEFVPLQDVLNTLAEKYGPDAVTTDGIHLTPRGHLLLAQKLVAYLAEPRYNDLQKTPEK